jgi:hypothetical protein
MRNFVLTLAVATGLVACGSSDFESTEVRPTATVEASASTETPATREDRFRNPDFQTTATPAPAPTPAPTENAIDRVVNSAPVSGEATR